MYAVCRCGWEIHPELDRFCGGCAEELVGIEFELPRDLTIEAPPGGRFSIPIRSVGQLPLRLTGIMSDSALHFESLPDLLEPHALHHVKARVSTEVSVGQSLSLVLESNAGAHEVRLRIVQPPALTLHMCGEQFQSGQDIIHLLNLPWKNPEENVYPFQLSIDAGEDEVVRVELLEAPATVSRGWQPLPAPLSATRPLDMTLVHRGMHISEQGEVLRIEVETLRTGIQTFQFQVKQFIPPLFTPEFSRLFKDEHALAPGSTHRERFRFTITNTGTHVSEVDFLPVSTWLSRVGDPEESFHGNGGQVIHIEFEIDCGRLPQDVTDIAGEFRLVYHVPHLPEAESKAFSFPVEFRKRQAIPFLAVDFGTSNTCVSFVDPSGNYHTVHFPFHHTLAVDAGKVSIAGAGALSGFTQSEVQTLMYLVSADEEGDSTEQLEFELSPQSRELRYQASRAHGTAFAWKKRLGSGQPLYLLSRSGSLKRISSEDLTVYFLAHAVAVFKQQYPYEAKNLIITHPVNFQKRLQSLLQDLGKRLGFRQVFVGLSEPEALALHFLADERNPAKFEAGRAYTIGMFDFGGGTTDLAILRYECTGPQMGTCQVIDAIGLPELGGEDLTFLLASHLHGKLQGYLSSEPGEERDIPFPADFVEMQTSQDPIVRNNAAALFEVAEKLKVGSARLPKRKDNEKMASLLADTFIPKDQLKNFEGLVGVEKNHLIDVFPEFTSDVRDADGTSIARDLRVVLPQEELESLLAPVINAGFTALNGMQHYLYSQRELQSFKVDYLILGGNSSRLPLVRKLAEEAELATSILHDPDRAKIGVAQGAAHFGLLLAASVTAPPLTFSPFGGLRKAIGFVDALKFKPIFPRGSQPGSQQEVHLTRNAFCDGLQLVVKPLFKPDDPSTHRIHDVTPTGEVTFPDSIGDGESFVLQLVLGQQADTISFAIVNDQQERLSEGEILLAAPN